MAVTAITMIVITISMVIMVLLMKNLGLLERVAFARHTREECGSSKKVERLHRQWL